SANSNPANAFIHVIPVDTAPTLDLDADNSSGAIGTAYAATFTQGPVPIPVAIADGDVAIADPDSPTLLSATITLTNAEAGHLPSGSGPLRPGATPPGYVPPPGVLFLTAAAGPSLADSQPALHQIEYSGSSASPGRATRRIEVVVNDGAQDSDPAIAFI